MDIFIGIEGEFVPFLGVEIQIGVTIDLGNPWDSGITVGGGIGAGCDCHRASCSSPTPPHHWDLSSAGILQPAAMPNRYNAGHGRDTAR